MMRVVMDLRRTPTGHISGHLHVPGAPETSAFDGWLGLMSLLESVVLDSGPDGDDPGVPASAHGSPGAPGGDHS